MIKIIKATIEDVDLITTIGKQSFLETHGHAAPAKDIDDFTQKTYNSKSIAKEFEDRNVKYHIIYFNDKAAGYSKIELSTPIESISDLSVTKLDRFYLLKEYYGKGLGSKLLDASTQLSKENEQNGMWLYVWVENQRALHFYKKAGFNIVGEYDFKVSETHSNPNHIMYLEY